MIVPLRTLDCAPLDGKPPLLGESDLRRIEPLQQVLLHPLDHPTIDEWRREVNRTLMAVFDSDAAMFQLDLEGEALQYSREFSDSHMGHYVRELMPEFATDRRLFRRALKLRAGTRWTLWRRHMDWFYRSDYFNELIMSMRAYDPLWVAAPSPTGGYPTMLHTYHDRRRSHHFFDTHDVALLRIVRPALEAGVRTAARMMARRASLSTALDAGRDGILLYDLTGRLLHRNAAAARLVASRDAENAVLRAGRQMTLGLAAAEVRSALRPHNSARTVSTRAGEYRLDAVRLSDGVFAPGPVVLVTLSSGEKPLPDRAEVRSRFGLTRRQAEVALLLARRQTNPEIAEALCISSHTVRSHVEAVMARLGVHDRREIGRLLT